MFTRRRFLKGALGAGAGLTLAAQGSHRAAAQTAATHAQRNKELVLRLKKSQGTVENETVMRETLAPGYKRLRGGMSNLAANARDQGFPDAGLNLRGAIPDRVDVIEESIAEGDLVGLIWRITGTHRGNLFGIPPTGKPVDVYEMGVWRVTDGKITEAWFMVDEAGLLKQLGAKLPPRKDGQLIAPPVTGAGEDPDAVLRRLEAGPLVTTEDRNRLMVARSKGSAPPQGDRAADYKQRRFGFQHLRDYGIARNVANQNITASLPGRRDRIDGFIAEGEKVWMRFKLAGIHGAPLYGLAPTGKPVEIPELGVMRIVDGKWKESWYFGDELGLLLQLNALHMLEN